MKTGAQAQQLPVSDFSIEAEQATQQDASKHLIETSESDHDHHPFSFRAFFIYK